MTAAPQDNLSALYPAHLAEIEQRSADALAACGRDTLAVAAGMPHDWFLDDQGRPFKANPHFLHWLPLAEAPGSWVVYTPGRKPKLIFLQPRDYWHVVPAAPSGYWVEHFDIVTIRTPDDARTHLPKDPSRCAIIGEANAAVGDIKPDNPAAALNLLHYRRAFKTPYEVTMMRVASKLGVHGHRAAEKAFREGWSEFDIHCEFLKATRLAEHQLPYGNIIALDAHGAVLHYMHFDRNPPAHAHSFLIDAGGQFHGYASDITRTYASPDAGEFQSLIDAVEKAQQGFCAKVRAGQSYPELHVHAHHVLMQAMHDQGFITCSPEAAVANGISSAFFPHGLGHLIGLQVHDVAGFARDEQGHTIPKPEGHPYLRCTRTLQPGMAVTIEPGLYFIDMLLTELKAKPAAKDVAWNKVNAFRKYGGIRIEDDVVCTDGDPMNLTREAFAAA
ncbi:MAG: Xaa-Pro dipeptidase PepQ [Rhodanobacteraceae bacterium]|jgi:Xaa-Pro dipeptidase|nr:MAG: Xaa-Pro dipeptidase PepQ [Rhodanobacteraceae bacterium]